ncbi:hypothetical protein N658DRAFT_560582 [Parathielavia hyrcaniae]|uniref:Uncharacterized protein n=1 Tax=Parathielavia hyrcaniae TaxID=113614 RepID=A0AAN6T011_9PEZI|nr:hypothetical protein N658DRAFT_560582 [Parathielavia hyrcaniae]
MALNYQKQRRLRYKICKKSKRAAACAKPSHLVEDSLDGARKPVLPNSGGLPVMGLQIAQNRRRQKAPKPKLEIKVINFRERVKILENALAWSEQRIAREERHRGRIQQLEQSNLLLRADAGEMKGAFSLELVRQRAINQQLQQDIVKMREDKDR